MKINYRTSHQIRSQADRLLDPQMADVDGNIEDRKGTISLFNGPQTRHQSVPIYRRRNRDRWPIGLPDLTETGLPPHEIASFVRSTAQLDRPKFQRRKAALKSDVLDEHVEITPGSSMSTMHLAKGLEFRAVGVMACDDEVIPLQERIETVTDEADLEDVYNTERHLLYVACTRARDHLLVTSTVPASEFLDDLMRSSETPA